MEYEAYEAQLTAVKFGPGARGGPVRLRVEGGHQVEGLPGPLQATMSPTTSRASGNSRLAASTLSGGMSTPLTPRALPHEVRRARPTARSRAAACVTSQPHRAELVDGRDLVVMSRMRRLDEAVVMGIS